MKMLYIPKLGEMITLARNWTFALHDEYRNETFIKEFYPSLIGATKKMQAKQNKQFDYEQKELLKKHGITAKEQAEVERYNLAYLKEHGELWKQIYSEASSASQPFTLPTGTVLKFERYYIRQGLKSFDSVTFRLMACPLTNKKHRFWVKLDDVNKIQIKEI